MNDHDLKQLAQYEQELSLLNTPSQSKSWWLGLPRNAELLSFALQLLREGFDIDRAFQARKLTGEGNNYKAILDTIRVMKHEDEEERRWAEELAEIQQEWDRQKPNNGEGLLAEELAQIQEEWERNTWNPSSLAEYEKQIDWKYTTGSARKWWLGLRRDKYLVKFAEKLARRKETITWAFLAHLYVGDDFKAILAVLMAYRRRNNRFPPHWPRSK